ncbi:MAG TPA: hypothetical protein VID51_01995 [Solirubrobacterales bacterium]|jgi:heme/copper-type cytochrome/quinol oxidase subunit 2
MNSNIARVAAGIAAVAVAVLLLVVLKDDGGGDKEAASTPTTVTDSTPGTTTSPAAKAEIPTIVVEGGKPVGGVKDLSFEEGDRIHFKVKSDVSDEIHVHGYDLMKDVEAGGTVTFDFPATIEGVFEAELEERKQPIAELTVNP